jgi:hypothetical protein
MEQPQKIEHGNERYKALREEIKDLKEVELIKKAAGKNYNPHFDHFDEKVLRDDDLEVYKKLKDRTLTQEEFLNYQNDFSSVRDATNPHFCFMEWIANQVTTPEWIEKWQGIKLEE